jgi:hypothetical protein
VRTWNLTPSVYVFIKVRDHVTHPYKTSNFLYIKKIIRLLDKKFSISTYNIVSHRVQTWATFTNNRPIAYINVRHCWGGFLLFCSIREFDVKWEKYE